MTVQGVHAYKIKRIHTYIRLRAYIHTCIYEEDEVEEEKESVDAHADDDDGDYDDDDDDSEAAL